VEQEAGTGQFRAVDNPISPDQAVRIVRSLDAPGTHSISLTGGEPLDQPGFCRAFSIACEAEGLQVFLETNGSFVEGFEAILPHIRYASIDIKLPSHRACDPLGAVDLQKREIRCIEMAANHGVYAIAKVVILAETSDAEFRQALLMIRDSSAEPDSLVIQPESGAVISGKRLQRLHMMACKEVSWDKVMVMPQMHKALGVL
jgi:organic radical activating enzyme